MKTYSKEKVFLEKVTSPEKQKAAKRVLSDATIRERLHKVLKIMGQKQLDCLIVYADVEHGSNFEYLCGFVPRFEEALLVLHKNAEAYLLLGNEVLGMAQNSRIPAKGIHVSYFSLPDQPLDEDSGIGAGLKKAQIRPGMNVGIVGWKGLYRYNAQYFDIPHYIKEAICGQGVTVCNATGLFIDAEYGVRAVNNIDEIAYYEYGQILAANGTLKVMEEIDEGRSEVEMAEILESEGQFHNVVTIFSTGIRFEKANIFPSAKRLKIGDRISMTVGYKGGLSSRAAYLAKDESDLPEIERDYAERLAKPYFAAITAWLEQIHVGMKGKELYDLIEEILPKREYHWWLNPGHLISDEEWMSSPIYPDSEILLRSGMLLQTDIIPVVPGYGGCGCENGVALADARMREEIQVKDPEMWGRFAARRNYLRKVLHINLHDDVLPMSNAVAFYRPYLLDKDSAFVNR